MKVRQGAQTFIIREKESAMTNTGSCQMDGIGKT
jgi:hypothetical protein